MCSSVEAGQGRVEGSCLMYRAGLTPVLLEGAFGVAAAELLVALRHGTHLPWCLVKASGPCLGFGDLGLCFVLIVLI